MKPINKKVMLSMGSHIVLLSSALFCLYTFFYQVAEENLVQFPYITWLVMAGNAVIGLTEIINDESFSSLHKLLDYTQLVLGIPCITADFWLNNEIGHYGLSYLHASLGFFALFFYIAQEYRRQDLTDLALLFNITSLIITGFLYENYFAVLAALIGAGAYFGLKRGESICLPPQGQEKYNMAMSVFNYIALEALKTKA